MKWFRKLKQPTLRFGSIMLLLLLTAYPMLNDIWSELVELFSTKQTCLHHEEEPDQSFTVMDSYQRAFASLQPKSSRVAILSIGSDQPGVAGNPCVGRAFMADLLTSVASSGATAVAVDKFYGADTCNGDRTSFQKYLNAEHTPPAWETSCVDKTNATELLQCVVAHYPIPLVIGSVAANLNNSNAGKYTCLCKQDGLPLRGPNVSTGYTRLNSDPLQVPTRWIVRQADVENSDYVGIGESMGLALAVASKADRKLLPALERKWRRAFDAPVSHPYVGVPASMESISALQYLCSVYPAETRERWNSLCGQEGFYNLSGKVVVIGSDDPQDYEAVLDKGMYGYKLQAMYVAAILGGAYLFDWALWLKLAVAIVLLYFVDTSAEKFEIFGRIPLMKMIYLLKPWEKLSGKRDGKSYDTGIPVILWVGFLCLLIIGIGWFSKYAGWLPPIDLMTTAFLAFVAKFMFYLKYYADRWSHQSEANFDGGAV